MAELGGNGLYAGVMGDPILADTLLRGFSKLDEQARLERFIELGVLDHNDIDVLNQGLPPELAECMIENRVGVLGIPLSLAVGVPIDDRVYPAIPMATEESSVVATINGRSAAIRERGHVSTEVLGRGTIGQIQFDFVENPEAFEALVMEASDALIADVNTNIIPTMVKRGGGMTDMKVRHIPIPDDGTHMAVVQITVDTCDAMGANIVNQICEYLQGPLEAITGLEANLRILSNLATERLVRARIEIDGVDPMQAKKIARASLFAKHDPWRAATHNKGIMNGVIGVALPTGQDTRALEAGAHTFAAMSGQPRGLSEWHTDGSTLVGTMTLPMAVGTVGGITRIHPQVQLAHKILDEPSSDELARITAATGLIQNLGALTALTSKGGITEGHMKLHVPNLAREVGARHDELGRLISGLREHLTMTGRVTMTDAEHFLTQLREQGT